MELRVHGIGSHDPSEILGAPILEDGDGRNGVYRRAAIARPDVRAFVWSRTTRVGLGLYRYLLLPFALVNVAGFMHLPGGTSQERATWDYRFLVHLIGASLTVSYLFWLLALTVDLPHLFNASDLYLTIASFVIPLLLLTPIILPIIWLGPQAQQTTIGATSSPIARPCFWIKNSRRSLFVFHLVNTLLIAGLVIALWPLGGDKIFRLFAIQVSTLILLGSVVLARAKRHGRSSEIGGLLLLVLAIALTHITFGGFQMALGELGDRLSMPKVAMPYRTLIISQQDHWKYVSTVLFVMAFYWGIFYNKILSTTPVTESEIAAALQDYGVAQKEKAPPWFARVLYMRLQLVIRNIPGSVLARLPQLLVGTAGIAVMWWFGISFRLYRPFYLIVIWTMTVTVAICVFTLWKSESSRQKIAILFDVIGYWPRRYHPLAPPPYAAATIDSLESALNKYVRVPDSLIVIGHSQGSVLAYSALARLPEDAKKAVDYITCGSPLKSLYATSFPAYFEVADFVQLREELRSWSNLHRDTDPIGTGIFGDYPSRGDVRILELCPATAIWGHSGYWEDPRMLQILEGLNVPTSDG